MGISSQGVAGKAQSKKENKYELENLLNESSSGDDDKDSEEGDGDDSWEKTSGDNHDINIDFGDDIEMGDSQDLIQMEEQKHDPNIEQF